MGTEIVSIHGRRVWDSRGRPTVEAEVRLATGAIGRAIAPWGRRIGDLLIGEPQRPGHDRHAVEDVVTLREFGRHGLPGRSDRA